jgi:hypothetical protein
VNPQRAAVRVALAAVAIALIAELVLDGHAFGINVAIATVALLLAALAIRPTTRPFDPLDGWLPVGAILFAGFIAIHDDRSLVVFDSVAALGCAGGTIAAIAGARVTRSALPALFDLGGMVVVSAIGSATTVIGLVSLPSLAAGRAAVLTPRVMPIARGLLIVLPLLVVFAVLFAQADPIFDTLLNRVLAINLDLGQLALHLAFVATVAWVSGGLLWFVQDPTLRIEPRSLGAAVRTPASQLPRLGGTEAITILVALDVLFGLFVILQVAYLFGGRDTVAASGMPYAQYARRGFFELLLVVALAGSLVGVLEAFVGLRQRAYVVALLALIGLTGVVLASSFLRLRLYQEAYGWTELRFYVDAAIAFFAVGLVAASVVIVRNQSHWLGHALGGGAMAVLVGVNLIGPQAFITDRNLERALNPGVVPDFGEETLDAAYLGRFDADAVPALAAALPRLSPTERASLETRLRYLRERLEDDRGDRAAWNLARERARTELDRLFGPRGAAGP